MTFEDFMKNWDVLDICHMSCDSYLDQIDKTDDVLILFIIKIL